MNKNTIIFLSLVATSLLTACDVQKVQRTQHEGPVKAKHELPPDKPASKADYENVDLTKIHSSLTSAHAMGGKSSQSTMEGVVKELGPIVLNNNYIQNPQFVASPKTRVMLDYFNRALLQMLEEKNPKAQPYLDKFQVVVADGCNENLRGCRNLGFFRQDQRSSSILAVAIQQTDARIESLEKEIQTLILKPIDENTSKELADKRQAKNSGIKEYYNLLALSFELKNVAKDQNIEFLYLKRARDYADYFQSLSEDEKLASQDILRRHGAVFENIVKNFPANVKDPRFKAFVANFKPWSYSRLEADPFPFGTRKMFSFAANNYMYENGQLSADLKKAIVESQTKSDRAGASFTQIVEEIRNNATVPFIFRAMKTDPDEIKKPDFFDEYFFIIDRLYRGHMDEQEVGEVWRASRKNVDRLMYHLEYYMKIQVIHKIIETNKYMASIVTQPDMNSETLIRQTIERSKGISNQWRDMLLQFNGKVATFLGTELTKSGSLEGSLKRANRLIDGLKRDIKYVSVYPIMFLLSYYIQDLQATLTINSFFGQIKIEPADIIEAIFSGGVGPWLSFGNDHNPLTKIEVLYAYYFALNTGTFETFGGLRTEKAVSEEAVKDGSAAGSSSDSVDRKKFFKKVIRQYLSKERNMLESAIRTYQNARSSNDYNLMIQHCDYLNSNNMNFTVNLTLEELGSFSIFGSPNGGRLRHLLATYRQSQHNPRTMFGDVLRTNYTYGSRVGGLEGKLLFLQSMVNILETNMKDLGFAESELNEVKKVTEEEVGSIGKLQLDYYEEVFVQHKSVSECIYKMLDFERQRQVQLILKEKENLEKVYDLMISLRGKSDEEVKQMLSVEGPKLGFVNGLDAIQGNTYIYNKLNALLRVKTYSEAMQPRVVVDLPTEVMRQDAARINRQISIVDSKGQDIKKEDFVKNALSYFKQNDNSFFYWSTSMSTIKPLQEKLDGMAEMYRFAQMQNIPAEKSVSVDELVTETFKIMDYVNIRSEEAQVLNLLGDISRVTTDELRGFLINDAMEPRGLLDQLTERLADLGAVFNEGIELYLTLENMTDFLFKVDKGLENMIRNRYVPFVQKNEKTVRDFISRVDQLEETLQSDKEAMKGIVYRLDVGGAKRFMLTDVSQVSGKIKLISPLKRNDTEARFYEFHERKTGRMFKVGR